MDNLQGIATVVPSIDGPKMLVLGHEATIKLASAQTGGAFYLFELLTPPGVGVPPHQHAHEDEVMEVLEGEIEVLLDGQTHRLRPGDIVNLPKSVPHGFSNVGETPVRTRFTVIPAGNFESFFQELSALPAGPPDPEAVTAIFNRYGMEILAQPPA